MPRAGLDMRVLPSQQALCNSDSTAHLNTSWGGLPRSCTLQQDFQSFLPFKYQSYINKPDLFYFHTENPLNCLLTGS